MQRRNFIAATSLSLFGVSKICRSAPPSIVINKKKRSQTIKTKILIVGGGPAGIGAAIGAAKTGAETLLIEN